MNTTRTTSIVAFLVGSAGLSLLVLGESPFPVIGGAVLTTAAAIYLTRHFWREAGRKSERTARAQAQTVRAEVAKLSTDVRSLNASMSESLGARTDEVSTRVTAFSRGVLEYVTQLELDVSEMSNDIERVRESIRKTRDLDDQRAQRYRDELLAQLSGVIGVYQVLQPRVPYPPFGGWAIDGGCARHFVSRILTDRPEWVVEMGSGLSTVLAAQAMDVAGVEGKVISLEHDERWAEQARELVERHGVAHRCRVVHAPLVDTVIDGETFKWYDLSLADLPDEIHLVMVDGPPKATGPLARYPAIPLLYDRLSIGATVLMDDAARPDERQAVERWIETYPSLSLSFLTGSKGLAELTKGLP